MTNSYRFRAILVPLLLLNGVVQADEDILEEVVVIGTRSEARSVLDSPVPVDVISADDIARISSIGGELGELLQALSPSFNFPRQSNSGSADHIRSAQLRGLSPDQVLVLVNGKRQHTTAVVNLEAKVGRGSNAFDFNTIPLISIKRIEILRDGAGAQYGSDAIAGVINIVLKDAPEGGRATITYGGNRTDFKPANKSINDGETFAVAADFGFAIGEDGSFRLGGEYRNHSATNRAGIGALPFFEESTPANIALDNKRLFAPGDGHTKDTSIFYNTHFALGQNEFYSFGNYNHRDAKGAAFFRYPDGYSGVPSVYPEGYRPVTTGDSDDVSIAAGLRGDAGATDWDISIIYGMNDYTFGVDDSINPSFGALSPTSFRLADFKFDQTTINVDLVRPFDVAAFSGPLNFAYGAELRFENYKTSAGDPRSYEAGPLADFKSVGAEAGPGLAANSAADVDRTVYAFYVDLEANVTDRLLIDVAARFEDYNDFGNSLTGKISGMFHVSDSFALRAAFGTSFRAPSLAQTSFEFSTQDFGEGGRLTVVGHLPVSDPLAIANGAIPLKEEKSVNLSAGFVVNLGNTLRLTVDYYKIDIDDRIIIVPGSTDNVTFFSNLVDTKTHGVDITVNGSLDLGQGMFLWNMGYNRNDTTVKNPSVIGEEELNTLETAAPDDKILLTGIYELEHWSFLLRAIRYGETTRDFDFGGGYPPAQTYGADWSIDAEVGFNVTESWVVAVGGVNVFDKYPDLSSDDNNYFGHLPYDVLPPIGMNGAYWYVRMSYDF